MKIFWWQDKEVNEKELKTHQNDFQDDGSDILDDVQQRDDDTKGRNNKAFYNCNLQCTKKFFWS